MNSAAIFLIRPLLLWPEICKKIVGFFWGIWRQEKILLSFPDLQYQTTCYKTRWETDGRLMTDFGCLKKFMTPWWTTKADKKHVGSYDECNFCEHIQLGSSDESELEFSGSSRAELGRICAKPSWGTLIFELKPS